jgi:1-acyl-sn-glycerol-3-phosphate acyltransferase
MDDSARRPFARLERLAGGRSGLVLVGGWAFAEAIFLPIVPDVVIGLLALVAPRRVPVLFAALVTGALAGTAVLYALSLANPGSVEAMLLALPGIHPATLDQARATVADGAPVSIALVGPGTPLKAYTFAWATGPATPLALLVGAVLNRVTRILPPLLLLTAVGWLLPGFLRRHDRLVLVAYATFYVLAYAFYWQ